MVAPRKRGPSYFLIASVITIQVVILIGRIAAECSPYDPPPDPGPYYFVNDIVCNQCPSCIDVTPQIHWRTAQDYGDLKVVGNLNLLAAVRGDTYPLLLNLNQRRVSTDRYHFPDGTSVLLQPFAFTNVLVGSKQFNLQLGSFLRSFLNDPLGGAKFDLTLPFTDSRVMIMDHGGAWNRNGSTPFHTAIDFAVRDCSDKTFNVVAAADGFVEKVMVEPDSTGNPLQSRVFLRHTASNGVQFLTMYQHLDFNSTASLAANAPVTRGQIIARTTDKIVPPPTNTPEHLHFAVAAFADGRNINGTVVPGMYYFLDPFGVYDYRRNFESSTDYNYVPNATCGSSLTPSAALAKPVHGIIHAYAWRTNPVIGSRLLPEDCETFNPDNLSVILDFGQGYFVAESNRRMCGPFSTPFQANDALRIIRQYRINRSCSIALPGSSFHYLKVTNQAPAGAVTGEQCSAFDPNDLNIEPLSSGFYRLVSGSQVLGGFPNMLEAGNALSTIKKYGFTRKCAFSGSADISAQYWRAEIGATGTFELFPAQVGATIHDPINYAFTWSVPAPRNWHDLRNLRFRIRDGTKTILGIHFDEASNTFSLFNEDSDQPKKGFAAGSPHRLNSAHAYLDLEDTTVVGSGPTGPSVTLNLVIGFKPSVADRMLAVEVAANDDLGHEDNVAKAGTITVRPKKVASVPPSPTDDDAPGPD